MPADDSLLPARSLGVVLPAMKVSEADRLLDFLQSLMDAIWREHHVELGELTYQQCVGAAQAEDPALLEADDSSIPF